MSATIELKFAKYLAFGLFVVTIMVLAGPVTDPVNSPKHLLLGAISFGLVPYIILNRLEVFSKTNLFRIVVSVSFAFFVILSVIFSKSPLTQNLYGTYGRNTGLITFLSFTLIFFAISNFRNLKSLELLIVAFASAGAVNIIYAFVYRYIGDPFPWNNIYNAFLGTFGNPNFSGAFCGIISAIYLSYLLNSKGDFRQKILFALLLAGSFFGVLVSKTTQGILVAGISITTVLFIFLAKQIKNRIITIGYLIVTLSISVITLLGMLQIGPMRQFVYKETVSLRGSYWTAAINAGKENLFTGIGMDTLGDWYRRSRSEKAATWLPGPDVITNSAHNYYLDIFASGGIFLLISYLGFTVIGIVSVYRIFKRLNSFDPKAALLIAAFFSFQAQAIISIPQIGIAVWGWVIIGMLASYSQILVNDTTEKRPIKRKTGNTELPIGVFIFVASSIGILVAVPPFSADAKWMSATKSQKLENVEAALTPNYFNPSNSNKFSNSILLMENNKLYAESHKYALKAIEFNSQLFEAWRALYFATNSTPSERALALENMRKLDPLNKKLDKLK